MKKTIFCALVVLSLSSCATILGGQKTDHQAHKPKCGEPRRQIRVGYVIADALFFFPGLIIDILDEKIYKPQPRANKIKKCHEKKTESKQD